MLLVGMYSCTLALENDWELLGNAEDRVACGSGILLVLHPARNERLGDEETYKDVQSSTAYRSLFQQTMAFINWNRAICNIDT